MPPLPRFLILSALFATVAGGVLAARAVRPAPAGPPRRIVSLNLCADQLVLALADRSQIAGLTRNATDVEMSAEAARARGLRLLSKSAEEIVALDPDLVIGMPARRSAAIKVLEDQNYRMVDLKSAERYDQIQASIRSTANAVGHPERGAALIARMDRELAGVPRLGRGRVAAYYQRRGFLTGTGTLIDEVMARAGLVNLATKLGKPALSQVSLEEMVAARPDFLIVESATDTVRDQGTEMLHHPALAGIPRISIPQAWTVCGSPAYVRAVRGIAEQIAAYDRAVLRHPHPSSASR
ncbi:ABC transporter substrate-binding protein [Novosphingobium sp. JCM 18896]|uniref:ABC transporter substrate-binding protein n=1 Tax=Novosphingobium sp. JCM 18896 TaxID=2989731 RepID=UPI002222FCD0|nr:ABC transporter substrate-binding protein [Novosphingobium sp. JCM 18896]MCW1427488.1 ABC transporter substrate-binding protein [Novosphingobium sp. JCM 18896]